MASDLPNGPSSPIAAPPVTVQILSPSLQAPLRLSSLPRDSTLKQLKARIREAVPHLGPADEDQRLIFNGRVLVQETDTLQGIFGDDGVCRQLYHSISLLTLSSSRNPTSLPRPFS